MAQGWEPDRRLTRNAAGSETSINFARSVAADERGFVHVAWVEQQDGNQEIDYKRSIDGGVSWGPPRRLTVDGSGSNNPSIAAEGEAVHVVFWDTRTGVHQIHYKRSIDGGASWEADRQITASPGGGAHCSVAVAGDGVHVVYVDGRDGSAEVYYVGSEDRGATWRPPQRLSALPWNSYTPTVAAVGDAVYVAWTDTRDQMQMGHLEEEYFRCSLDGGATWEAEIRLTVDPANSWAPSLAADASDVWIVWFDDRSGDWELYAKRSSDRGATWSADRRLSHAAGASLRPSIAQRGDELHVVFWATRDGNEEVYWLRSTDRGDSWDDPARLTRSDSGSVKPSVAASLSGVHVVWTDGRDGNAEVYYKRLPGEAVAVGNGRIAFSRAVSGRSQIFTVNADGGDERQLTFEGANEYPAWSKDGAHLAFVSDRTGAWEVWAMNADGSGQSALTAETSGGNFVPDWSHDGSRIAFTSVRDGVTHPTIWVIDAHGGQATRLTSAPSLHPTWEPGDERIYYASDSGNGPDLWGMFADGQGQERKTEGLGPGYPNANVPEFARSGRKVVFWAGMENQFGEVWSVDFGDPFAGPRRLTETPDPLNSDNPAWSPDGNWILFDTNRSRTQAEIWIMAKDGSGARPLILGAGQVSWQPVPAAGTAPDLGGQIALTLRDRGGRLQIFTITPDGTNRTQLTFEGENGRADWSPDGGKIAFNSTRDGRVWVAVMDADGSHQQLLVEGAAPDWSPDGTQISFSRADDRQIVQIWVIDADGRNIRRITESNTAKIAPSWSPDGTEMVFILPKNPGSPTDPQPEIGIMNSDGTNERVLTTADRLNTSVNPDGSTTVCETANDANAPAWSPVDNRITFWSGIENQHGQVWVIHSDGTGSKQLTEDCSHRNSDDPSWSPDGMSILFSTGRSGRNELWVMNADGSDERRISDIDAGPFPGRASWQPSRRIRALARWSSVPRRTSRIGPRP